MLFAEANAGQFAPRREPHWWRAVLLLAAAIGVFTAVRPWTKVRFVRLFGEHLGPPAWQSTAGFTCLITCALVAVITLSESKTRSSHQAVRPASLLLAAVLAVVMAMHTVDGPGRLRGVTAEWTSSFYVSAGAALALLLACAKRYQPTR